MTSKLSRDQKRKQKLARRASREPSRPAGPDAYRSVKYIKAVMRAEMGILETDAMLHRALTDRDVEASVRRLAHELRAAPSEGALLEDPAARRDGGPHEMLVWNIERNWQDLFATEPRHSNADLAGLLGVILTSIGHWSRSGRGPRAYLDYLEGFLGGMGVRVVRVPLG